MGDKNTMSDYTKVVTQQGVYKTTLSLQKTENKLKGSKGFVRLPAYGKNKEGSVKADKVTMIRKG